MLNNLKFKGCPYPIVKDPMGYLKIQSGAQQIKADLMVLLLTEPGERVMLPSYGTPLRQLFFEPNDPALRLKAKNIISKSISEWEPRVQISQISVFQGTSQFDPSTFTTPQKPTFPASIGYSDQPDDESALGIRIKFFDPENISQVQELVLSVPIT